MTKDRRERQAGAGAAPLPPYDPPRVEKLGSLRDLLAAKSGPGNDPSPMFVFDKK